MRLQDGSVRLWSVGFRDGFEPMVLVEHRSPVRGVFLSDDLQYVYSMPLGCGWGSRGRWLDVGCGAPW